MSSNGLHTLPSRWVERKIHNASLCPWGESENSLGRFNRKKVIFPPLLLHSPLPHPFPASSSAPPPPPLSLVYAPICRTDAEPICWVQVCLCYSATLERQLVVWFPCDNSGCNGVDDVIVGANKRWTRGWLVLLILLQHREERRSCRR